jgi:hypothetical protein
LLRSPSADDTAGSDLKGHRTPVDISVQDDPVGAAPAAPSGDSSASVVSRRLLGAGLAGALAAALPALAGRAAAGSTRQPSAADVELLSAAQTVELAAVALYDAPLRAGSLGATTETVVRFIRDAHLASAQQLGALLGRVAPGSANQDLVDARSDQFVGGSSAVATAGASLENTLVETHTDLLGRLEGVNGARLVAAILSAEARFATVLTDLSGQGGLDELLTTNGATSLLEAEA